MLRRSLSRTDGGSPFVCDPKLSPTEAPAFWQPELVPDAVIIVAAPPGFTHAGTLDLAELGAVIASRRGEDGCHAIIADPAGDHRLWLMDAAPGTRLGILIPLDDDFRFRLEGIERFHRLLMGDPTGPRPRRLDLTVRQRRRLALMLRAVLGRRAGASYREIGAVLFDPKIAHMPARDWKLSAEHSHLFRLVKDAWSFIDGGYRRLLRGDWP